jgi:hypothetical protein
MIDGLCDQPDSERVLVRALGRGATSGEDVEDGSDLGPRDVIFEDEEDRVETI